MAILITYFPHGTSKDNEAGISSGWSDAELSTTGEKQAIDLKNKIGNKKFDVIFTSNLKRAVHSAELAFEGMAPIIHDSRLRECSYGDFNGQSSAVVEPMQEHCILEKFPNGESYEDVKTRVNDFIQFLKKNYNGKSIAIVAHKAPQLALDVLIKGKTWKEAFQEDWRKKKAWQPGWEYVVS